MLGEVVVHTTGINWQAILANVASITVVLGAFGAVIVRSIRRSIKDEVTDVISEKVTPLLEVIQGELQQHDTRIARLEGAEQGRRYAVDAAAVTTKTT